MALIILDFDSKKLQRGFADIQKANVIATRNTLNVMAALTRRNAIKNLNDDFINRNNFTRRQIQFRKAQGEKIGSLFSRAGATERAPYMELQEKGGINKPKKGSKLAIATNRARGGSKSKLIARQNYQRKVKQKKVKGKFSKNFKSKKARNVARAFVAKREQKFLKISSGIYSVTSFNKISKNRVKYKKNMIYNTKESSVKIKKTPWLEPAYKKPVQDGQVIYNSQINKLLKKAVI